MNKDNLKLEGWKSKKKVKVGFLQCPYCKHYFNSVVVNPDKTVKCNECMTTFLESELKHIIQEKQGVICKMCDAEVSLTSRNLNWVGGYGYICSECENIVAIKFKNYIIQPQTPMKLYWNKEIMKKALKINDNISFAICKGEKDLLTLKIMQLMAKEEGCGFYYIKEKSQKAGLVFDPQKKKYFGYVVWSKNKSLILRQIFIIKDERKKGFGSAIMKFWVDNFAIKTSDKFGVESPNKLGKKILIKLGYARIEEGQFKGIKCFFLS